MSDATVQFLGRGYLWLAVLVALPCCWLAYIWEQRKPFARGRIDGDDIGVLCIACPCGAIMWGLIAVGLLIWGLAQGFRFPARAMLSIEAWWTQRAERQALEAKAQREIFVEVDRMLRESNTDEINSFMAKLSHV